MRQSKEIDSILEGMPRRAKNTKALFDIGINNSPFCTSAKFSGKVISHRAYASWSSMFKRCYSAQYQEIMKTYSGCSVSPKWQRFYDFLLWWKRNYSSGWHLDKDLLIPGNKEYSPDACLYIPMHLNAFASMSFNRGDDWPIGAFLHKRSGKFFSKVNDGRRGTINLGTFRTPIEAHQAWYEAKMEMAIKYESLCNSIHPKLHAGLIRKIESLHHPDAKNLKTTD